MTLLQVSGLDLYYGDAQALAGVALHIDAGEIVAIVGANGAGKSSLIRAIHGIHRRSAARASRARVRAFSLTSSCPRAASQSFGDTIGGVFMAIDMVDLLLMKPRRLRGGKGVKHR